MKATSRVSLLAVMTGAIITSTLAVSAQTADQIKSRFATLLGPNKFARMVWQRQAQNGQKPNNDVNNGPTSLVAVDTKDGIVRTLVAAKNNTYWGGATLTWDGTRVVYYDYKAHTIRRINFDGTGDTLVASAFAGEGRCWKSSDGKDWILGTEYTSGSNAARIVRINIDNPTERVTLFQMNNTSDGYGVGKTQWATMSVDGKYVAGGFPGVGQLGFFAVAATPPTTFTRLDPNGCYISISRDNNYRLLYTDDGPLSHQELYMRNVDGTGIVQKPLKAGGVFAATNEYFESLRLSSDPDYCTFFHYKDGLDGTGFSNPVLLRISDLKWAGVRDNLTTVEGNADAYIYSGTVTKTALTRGTPARINPSMTSRTFDLQGRPTLKGSGARIVPTANGGARVVLLIDK